MLLDKIKQIESPIIKRCLRNIRTTTYSFIDLFLPYITSRKYLGFQIFYTKRCGLIDRIRFLSPTKIYEKDLVDEILSNIKDDSVMIDIGANIGLISLSVLAKKPNIKIFAYEPGKLQNACFNLSIHKNMLGDKITLRDLALSDKKGVASFYCHGEVDNSGDGLQETHRSKAKGYVNTVITDMLDNEINLLNIKKVDVIKLDVEGAELLVLQGMRNLLKEQRPIVYIEISAENISAHNISIESILEEINSSGYKLVSILDKSVLATKQYIESNLNEDMYLMLPIQHE